MKLRFVNEGTPSKFLLLKENFSKFGKQKTEMFYKLKFFLYRRKTFKRCFLKGRPSKKPSIVHGRLGVLLLSVGQLKLFNSTWKTFSSLIVHGEVDVLLLTVETEILPLSKNIFYSKTFGISSVVYGRVVHRRAGALLLSMEELMLAESWTGSVVYERAGAVPLAMKTWRWENLSFRRPSIFVLKRKAFQRWPMKRSLCVKISSGITGL